MTITIALLLVSLLIIAILRTARRSQEEIPAEQEMKSPVKAEEISEPLPEPQAEIIANPPYRAEEEIIKKPAQKKPAPVKKTQVKKVPAKKVPAKKTTPKK